MGDTTRVDSTIVIPSASTVTEVPLTDVASSTAPAAAAPALATVPLPQGIKAINDTFSSATDTRVPTDLELTTNADDTTKEWNCTSYMLGSEGPKKAPAPITFGLVSRLYVERSDKAETGFKQYFKDTNTGWMSVHKESAQYNALVRGEVSSKDPTALSSIDVMFSVETSKMTPDEAKIYTTPAPWMHSSMLMGYASCVAVPVKKEEKK